MSNTAILYPWDRQLLTWTVDVLPEDADLEVSFDDGDSWHPLTSFEDGPGLYVAGSEADADDSPAGTVVLDAGEYAVLIRAVDNPEVTTARAGWVHLKA